MEWSDGMRVFVRVLERGSFSAAADDLGLTPSAVLRLVSRLEDRVGVQLLQRSTRRLALTSEGETYLVRARRILADIDDAEAEIAQVRGAPRGQLRINSGIAFGVHQLTRALPEFLASYPEIDVELSLSDRQVDHAEDHADVAIRHGHLSDSALMMRRIVDLQRVICAAPAYLTRRGTPHRAGDLADHDCILVTAGPGLHRWPFRTRSSGVDVIEVSPRVITGKRRADHTLPT